MTFVKGKIPEGATPFQQGNPGGPGRPLGSKSRSTIVRKWLEVETEDVNPLTGLAEKLSYEDIITLQQIKKAKEEQDTNAYKALQDSAYGAPKQETDVNNNVTLTNFNIKDVLDFDNPKSEV